ncbi:MAG: DUF3426 domain-containing protein [Trichlorobacter sp.]|jgi:predicted Zn finger-like uncharacterized protein
MIIQCEQCRTKFKLDDEKVTKRGARVRCAKCRHVFTVHKPDDETVPPVPDETLVMPAAAAAVETTALAAASTFDLGQTDAAVGPDFGEVSFTGVTTEAITLPAAPAWDDKTVIMPPAIPPEPTAVTGTGIDFGTVMPQMAEAGPATDIRFDFGDVIQTTAQNQNTDFDFTTKPSAVAASTGDIDFGGFDFGDVSVAKPDEGFSLSGADFGNLSAVSQPAAGSSVDFGFSFGDAEAPTVAVPSDVFDFSGLDFGSAQTGTAAAPVKTDDSFSLGDFDFGGEAASVAIPASTTDQNSALFNFSQPQTSAPAVLDNPTIPATAAIPQGQAQEFTFDQSGQEEPSPLSISSRRRQSPVFSTLIAVVCLLVIGALACMGYLFLGKNGQISSLFNKTASSEEGKIVVQNLQASFLTKSAAGDLLIITGEALNSFSKPRAALQVKATIFDANNQPLLTQTAYAGNLLTHNQLASMPHDKILTTMGNQFGDSLTNLEVPPGKTIPFTLVIVNPPMEGKDYTVEAVGSTVAARK